MRAPPPGAAPSTRRPPTSSTVRRATSRPRPVEPAPLRPRSAIAVDVLMDNVFSHTPDRTPFRITVREAGDRIELVVDVAGRTAESAGGRLVLGAAPGGGARIVLELPRA